MSEYKGPLFQRVEEVTWNGNFKIGDRKTPLLIKGAVRSWPAWQRWSFEQLAELKRKDGSDVVVPFTEGLVEQGDTPELPLRPVGPYLRELARQAQEPVSDDVGLMPLRRLREIRPQDWFHLQWDYMQSFTPNRLYLTMWDILRDFPQMKRDFAISELWPGWRWRWEYVFMGPSRTVTGWHADFPNNLFCQVRGTKEVLLVPPEYNASMCVSKKYDLGAVVSNVNVAKLNVPSPERDKFAQVRGIYARVEAGDVLFIPGYTWHAVVAMEPSISLAVFGLTPWEMLVHGTYPGILELLHRMRLYRWGDCTCHKSRNAGRGY